MRNHQVSGRATEKKYFFCGFPNQAIIQERKDKGFNLVEPKSEWVVLPQGELLQGNHTPI